MGTEGWHVDLSVDSLGPSGVGRRPTPPSHRVGCAVAVVWSESRPNSDQASEALPALASAQTHGWLIAGQTAPPGMYLSFRRPPIDPTGLTTSVTTLSIRDCSGDASPATSAHDCGPNVGFDVPTNPACGNQPRCQNPAVALRAAWLVHRQLGRPLGCRRGDRVVAGNPRASGRIAATRTPPSRCSVLTRPDGSRRPRRARRGRRGTPRAAARRSSPRTALG